MKTRQVTIQSICDLNFETIGTTNAPTVIRYLDTSSITRNKINNLQILDSSITSFPSRAKRKVKNGSIVYSTVRPNLEHFGFLANPEDNLIVSTGFVTLDVKDNNIDPKFLYYYITQKYITDYMYTVACNNVSSYPSINPSDLGSLEIDIPIDKKIQLNIASVLSSLDSKIEINNSINAELEATAKLLYDYWFVQFDFPDKQGKPYKSNGGKMVWNEKLNIEIPDGWDDAELQDIANITMGQSPPGESYNEIGEGQIFYQGCTDFGNRFPTVRQFTTKPSRLAKEGDILLSVRAPVGTLNIAKENCCIGRGLAALSSKDNCIAYLFGVMVNLKHIFDRRNADGTTFGAITKDDLYSLKVVKPHKDVLRKFHTIMNSAFEKQNTIELENLKLSELRDWLLPMLMSGKVKVL